MTGLIERDLVIDKLKQGYFDKKLQLAKDDPCVIDAMIDWSIRQVKDVPIYNPWHDAKNELPMVNTNLILHIMRDEYDTEGYYQSGMYFKHNTWIKWNRCGKTLNCGEYVDKWAYEKEWEASK